MKCKLFISLLMLLLSFGGNAQELLCNVTVNAQKITSTDKTRFDKMQNAIRDFMNTRIWTPHVFAVHEKIICDISITILEQRSETEYVANFLVMSQRPVYQTMYSTPVLKFMDTEVSFSYQESMPMDFNEMGSNSPLIAVLAYWANTIIGLDYDSFSVKGGSDFFSKAEKIVQNKVSDEGGWSPGTPKRTRYKLNADLMDPRYLDLRLASFKYHRQGLDVMAANATKARIKFIESLRDFHQIYKMKPDQNMVYFSSFFEAKAEEIVGIFSEGSTEEKKQVYDMLREMDNANESKYKKLIK